MPDQSAIALFSLNQRDADVGVGERFAETISTVRGPDALVLLTCHRAEVLTTSGAALAGTALPASGHLRTGRDAALHFLRVACGLDSAIVGEAQILGQLRRTFEAGQADGGLH